MRKQVITVNEQTTLDFSKARKLVKGAYDEFDNMIGMCKGDERLKNCQKMMGDCKRRCDEIMGMMDNMEEM